MADKDKKSNVGRKAKYNPERVRTIVDAISSGSYYCDAAKKAGISESTFYEWMQSKAEFSEAVKSAEKRFHDWQMTEMLNDAKRSLKTLILGQEYEEVKIEYEPDPGNPTKPRIKRQTTTRKKILPNATAVIFTLCNRDPENWKNRVEQELSGKVETDARNEVSLAGIPDELLAQVIEALGGKA